MAFVAVQVALSVEERARLEAVVAAPTSGQRMARRARAVLLAVEGWPNRRIAGAVGLSAHKVGQWRNRCAKRRLDGLGDLPRLDVVPTEVPNAPCDRSLPRER